MLPDHEAGHSLEVKAAGAAQQQERTSHPTGQCSLCRGWGRDWASPEWGPGMPREQSWALAMSAGAVA